MISVNEDMKQEMLRRGISVLHPAPFGLPEDCVFEPPCSIKWMGVDYCLTMGAFSYAVSGYYFGADIARWHSQAPQNHTRLGTGIRQKDFGKVRVTVPTLLYIPIGIGVSW